MSSIQLIGLDFGSTTCSMIAATADVLRNCATGRMELASPSVKYRSELSFTPYSNGRIDEPAIADQVDRWIHASGLDARLPTSGGVIVTGLAAQQANVAA